MREVQFAFASLLFATVGACAAAPAKSAAPPPEAVPASAVAAPPPEAAPADPMPRSEGKAVSGGKVSSADMAADLAAIANAESQLDALGMASDKKKSEAPPTKGGGASRAQASGASGCASACSALGSMTRATEHLCTLTGEGDARCSDARSRTKIAETRVKGACSC